MPIRSRLRLLFIIEHTIVNATVNTRQGRPNSVIYISRWKAMVVQSLVTHQLRTSVLWVLDYMHTLKCSESTNKSLHCIEKIFDLHNIGSRSPYVPNIRHLNCCQQLIAIAQYWTVITYPSSYCFTCLE